MGQTPSGPDLRQPIIPPILLALGSIVWKLLDWAGRIDFILSVQNQSFAVIFQAFASYGWLLIVAVCVLWWYQARKQAEDQGEYRITWGLVVSFGILSFLYGVLLTVYSTGTVPNVIASYGRGDGGCQSLIDTTRLTSFKTEFHLVVACGISNPAVDQLDETGISISAPFNISPGGVAILTPLSPTMEAELKNRIPQQTGVWFQAILVPKDIDLSKISRLSEIQKQGGKIIAPGLF